MNTFREMLGIVLKPLSLSWLETPPMRPSHGLCVTGETRTFISGDQGNTIHTRDIRIVKQAKLFKGIKFSHMLKLSC